MSNLYFDCYVQSKYISILKQRAEERKREMDIIYEKYDYEIVNNEQK